MVRNYVKRNRKVHECALCEKLFVPKRAGALFCRERCRKQASRLFPMYPKPTNAEAIRRIYKTVWETGEKAACNALSDLVQESSAPRWVNEVIEELQRQIRVDEENGYGWIAYLPALQKAKFAEWIR